MTAATRASALAFGLVFSTLVIPDGTVAQADRQTIANTYGGILATAAVAAPDCNFDVYGFVGNIPTDVLLAIVETEDVLKAMEENQDLRKTISTDPTDVLKAIVEDEDVSGEIC